MKKTATLIIVLALTFMTTLPLFAGGVTEGGPHFKELDLNTVTFLQFHLPLKNMR